MRRRSSVLLAACLVVPVLALGTTGCAKSTRLGQIRAQPAPELKSLDRTKAERKNNWATVRGTNLRNLNSALGRTFYTNRPSRLSPAPIPY
ncbi:MAG: hypothetical protein ACF8QF_14460 [Phycisphaerales bacterium]